MKHKFMFTALFFLQTTLISLFAYSGKHETTIRNFWKTVDHGQFDKAEQFLHTDVQVFIPLSPQPLHREAFKQLGENFRSGFPDIRHEVIECTEGQMTAAVRGIFSGTNTGSLMGNPPTNNQVELAFLQYWTFDKSGKAVRIDIVFDHQAFTNQLMKGIPKAPTRAQMLANRFFNAPGSRDAGTILNALLAADFRSVQFPGPGGSAKDEYIKGIFGFLEAFPDMKISILNQFSEGNQVFSYGYWEGTHQANLMGIPATSKKVHVDFMDIWTEKDGQLIRNEVVMDLAGLMAQLGVNGGNNKAISSEMMMALDKHDLDGVLAHCSPAARFNGWAPQALDAKGYRQAMLEILKSFPDARFKVNTIISEGNLVVVQHQLEGTHNGAAFNGIPVTGRKVIVPASVTFQFKDGKAEEMWLHVDRLGLLMQLGVNPLAKN